MPHPFDPPPARTPIAVLAIGLLLSGLLAWLSFAESARAALFVLALGAGLAVALSALARRPAAAAANAAATETARLREMAELSSDWFWEQDAQFRYTAMSGGVVNKGNFRIEEALGRARWELPILGVSEAEWARHRALLERHEPFRDFTYQIRLGDGEVRWYAVNGNPVFDAAGRFCGYRGTGHDISVIKRAELALQASEERMALALDAAGAGVWDYDPLAGETYFSPRFASLLGYAGTDELHAEFLVQEALHADDRARVLAAQERVLASTGRFDQTYRLRHKSGDYRWFHGLGLSRAGADGQVARFTGVITDITPQVEAEAALRESEAQLNRAQKVARLGSWHRDLATKRLTWSLGNYRLCGIAPGTPLTHELLTSLLHPDDREMVRDTWNGVMQGKAYDFEHRILVDGETRWLHDKSEIAFDDEGRPVFATGVAQDITERKRAEAQLRLLASVFESSPEGITITDPDQRILAVNRAFTRITGYSEEEAIGQTPRLLQSGRHDAKFYRALWGAIRQHGFWRGEIWNRRKNGEIFPELIGISAVRDGNGDISNYIGIFTDITEIKRNEEAMRRFNAELERRVTERTQALQASNRELEAFSYSVSHDLRAPLRAIDGYSRIIAEDYADRLDDTALAHFDRIRAASQRMGQIIDAMLDLARLSRAELRREDIDLSALAALICGELVQDSSRQAEFAIAPDIHARADRSLLTVVMQNLIHNACKFTARSEPARIEFGTAAEAGETVYFVRDNGAGFDPAHAGKLFGAFQRLHRPDEYAGTGIGLATVQRIVLRHGGRVWAEGAVGAGATFYFTLG